MQSRFAELLGETVRAELRAHGERVARCRAAGCKVFELHDYTEIGRPDDYAKLTPEQQQRIDAAIEETDAEWRKEKAHGT